MSDFGTNIATNLATVGLGQALGDSAGKQYRYWRKKMIRTDRMQRDTWKWMKDQELQLRVADGRKAGLSPLASIGAAGAQMPNLNVGGMSGDPGSRYADVLTKATLSGQRAQTEKTDAEKRYIEMLTDLTLDNHIRRNRITQVNPTKDANTDKPPATIAADTTIDDWEPGDIQLLSEEMSQSFESLTSTLATAAINAGLYGSAAVDWLKEKYPDLKNQVISKVQGLIDDYYRSEELPEVKTPARLRKPSKAAGSPSPFSSRKHYLKRR